MSVVAFRLERWGVENSFFTKHILLFINNLQIFEKNGLFVPFVAFLKEIRK